MKILFTALLRPVTVLGGFMAKAGRYTAPYELSALGASVCLYFYPSLFSERHYLLVVHVKGGKVDFMSGHVELEDNECIGETPAREAKEEVGFKIAEHLSNLKFDVENPTDVKQSKVENPLHQDASIPHTRPTYTDLCYTWCEQISPALAESRSFSDHEEVRGHIILKESDILSGNVDCNLHPRVARIIKKGRRKGHIRLRPWEYCLEYVLEMLERRFRHYGFLTVTSKKNPA